MGGLHSHYKLTSHDHGAPLAAGLDATTQLGKEFIEPVWFQRTMKARWDGATPEDDRHSVLFISGCPEREPIGTSAAGAASLEEKSFIILRSEHPR